MSMTIAQIEDKILSTFITDWADQTEYTFNAEKYEPQEDDSSWISIEIQFLSRGQESLGGTNNRIFRNMGRVIMTVHSPISDPLSVSTALASDAINIFEGKHLDDIWFRDVGIVSSLPVDKWYERVVSADFICDEIK